MHSYTYKSYRNVTLKSYRTSNKKNFYEKCSFLVIFTENLSKIFIKKIVSIGETSDRKVIDMNNFTLKSYRTNNKKKVMKVLIFSNF